MAKIRPQKAETHRTRLTVGGNLIIFPGDVTTPAEDLITANLIFNSVLSTENAKLICAYISDFYLDNPMNRYEYMKLPLYIIPEETSNNTTPEIWHTKVLYVCRYKKACMGYPRQAKLQIINLSYICPILDTSQHPSPQVYGGTKLAQLNFHW